MNLPQEGTVLNPNKGLVVTRCVQPTLEDSVIRQQIIGHSHFADIPIGNIYVKDPVGGNFPPQEIASITALLMLFHLEQKELAGVILGKHPGSECLACKHGYRAGRGLSVPLMRLLLRELNFSNDVPIFVATMHTENSTFNHLRLASEDEGNIQRVLNWLNQVNVDFEHQVRIGQMALPANVPSAQTVSV